MMRTKDVYYKNRLYKIPVDDLKYINGCDVAKLPNDMYVYYDDLDRSWKTATQILIEEYTGKRYINVEFNGDIIKTLSHIDLEENIENKKITKVNIECIVVYDDIKNAWKILEKDNVLYKIYIEK